MIILNDNRRPSTLNTVNVQTKITAAISDTDTTIFVSNVDMFPENGEGFLTLDNEKISFNAIDIPTKSITGCTRGEDSTRAVAHSIDTIGTITDQTYDGVDNFDYLYVSGLTGNNIAIYTCYRTMPNSTDTSIRLTYDTIPHSDGINFAWYPVSYIDSSNNIVPLTHELTASVTDYNIITANSIIPVNFCDETLRIKIEYVGAVDGDITNNILIDIQFEERV